MNLESDALPIEPPREREGLVGGASEMLAMMLRQECVLSSDEDVIIAKAQVVSLPPGLCAKKGLLDSP